MYKRASLEKLFQAIDEIKSYDLAAFPGELEEVLTALIKESDELQAQENKLSLVAFDSKHGTSLHAVISPAGAAMDEQVARALFPEENGTAQEPEDWVIVSDVLESNIVDYAGAVMQEDA